MRIVMIICAAISLTIASCAKCTTCTKSNAPDVRVCEEDYDSKTAYGLAIDIYEGQNYDCRHTP